MMSRTARTRVSRNVIVPIHISFEWRLWFSGLLVGGWHNFCLGIDEHRGSEQGWEGGLSGV